MRSILAFVAAAALSAATWAQQATSDSDHAVHHPDGASAPASAPKATSAPRKAAPKPAAKASAPSAMPMDATMKSMQEMHDRMMAAKTADERQALMADHMKAMQEGMAMMGQMKDGKSGMGMGSGMSSGSDAMGKRMDMMEMMMQMMMDREAARAPASR